MSSFWRVSSFVLYSENIQSSHYHCCLLGHGSTSSMFVALGWHPSPFSTTAVPHPKHGRKTGATLSSQCPSHAGCLQNDWKKIFRWQPNNPSPIFCVVITYCIVDTVLISSDILTHLGVTVILRDRSQELYSCGNGGQEMFENLLKVLKFRSRGSYINMSFYSGCWPYPVSSFYIWLCRQILKPSSLGSQKKSPSVELALWHRGRNH